MIIFFIGCILLGLILAVILAPIIAVRNQIALKKMKKIVDAARHIPKEDVEGYRRKQLSLLNTLYDLKSTIVADRRSLVEADDIIELFKFITS